MTKELHMPRSIKAGVNSIQDIGKAAKELYATHVFIVTGSLAAREPYKSEIIHSFATYGVKASFFSQLNGEPTLEDVRKSLKELKNCKADCVVAIGGGSVIDLAKAISFLCINENSSLNSIPDMKRLERLPLIAVPTTAGTGSEATKVTVISDKKMNIKLNPGHYKLIPDVAILDPALTVSMPDSITAYTGMDALAHAMEAYVSTKATPMSNHFALEAIRIIGKWLPEAYRNGDSLEARENMLIASLYAGIAFSNSSTNLVHAAARPLGTRFGIPHGLSVSLLLPFVMEYGLKTSIGLYADIGKALGCPEGLSQKKTAEFALEQVLLFNLQFQIWDDGAKYLHDRLQFPNAVPSLVSDALSGNGIKTNQKIPTGRDIEKIYQNLWKKVENHQESN
ncbi:iron-containing alcohol dehydrogenase [Bacillus sp. P14.5]|uniref:iron-containing alcohol dehydrogenase n=1 Tax=Bacillus sp. P14.5 TaxID=1983400 RepID=UPI000DE9DC00|nr:iron-containing alcohol dehydrogenase [Bacillus sp. P14.5]